MFSRYMSDIITVIVPHHNYPVQTPFVLQILMNVILNLELQTAIKMHFALILKEVLNAAVLTASLVMEEFVTAVCAYKLYLQ